MLSFSPSLLFVDIHRYLTFGRSRYVQIREIKVMIYLEPVFYCYLASLAYRSLATRLLIEEHTRYWFDAADREVLLFDFPPPGPSSRSQLYNRAIVRLPFDMPCF